MTIPNSNQDLEKQKKKSLISLLLSDRFLVLFFFIFDLSLLLYSKSYFDSLSKLAIRSISSAPESKEIESLQQLEKAAVSGSWENFEKVRLEELAYYLTTHTQPSNGYAIYFIPEILPAESFEKVFVELHLQPGIENLKRACLERDPIKASQAYLRLSDRVKNFELGASGDEEELSPEAREFLRLYQEFTKFTLPKMRN